MKRAVVIGHADADGYLISEQVRRNLAMIKEFNVEVIVDPALTRDHRCWLKLNEIHQIADADFVFFVDLMFSPATFVQEAEALVHFVQSRPTKRFFLVDHHPLPTRRLHRARNLRAIYRPEVFECALGPRSGMMVVAALCEKQSSSVADVKQPVHDVLALGMRRAAAPGGPLPGRKLLALLRSNEWESILRLGLDAKEHHRLPRGRRPVNEPHSSVLTELDEMAMELLSRSRDSAAIPTRPQPGDNGMPYDAQIGKERFPNEDGKRKRATNYAANGQDLEAIVTLLEVAALSLTDEPGATFTVDQLIHEAREIGGEEIDLDETDVKIVLQKASFVQKISGGELRLK